MSDRLDELSSAELEERYERKIAWLNARLDRYETAHGPDWDELFALRKEIDSRPALPAQEDDNSIERNMLERIKRWRERRRAFRNKKDFSILKGAVLVPEEEMNAMRKIKVPVRCLDGTVVLSEKEIPEAVCKAVESLCFRILADHERFVDLSYQPRKKSGRVKVTALLGVMCAELEKPDESNQK